MNDNYTLLTEKDAMWAEMLLQVLRDHDIPCAGVPVYGAGLTIKTGAWERLRVFVAKENESAAKELMNVLFSPADSTD